MEHVRDIGFQIPPEDDVSDGYYKAFLQMDIYSPNITCGRNAFDSAPKTEAADVVAGSEVGFRSSP
jgi:hypothetical protein